MRRMRIYLAGPMSRWRDGIIFELKNFYEFYNPVVNSRQKCQIEYAADDLNGVKNCDIIFAFQPKDKMPCLAMAVEATFGFCNGAIVIYVDEREAPDPIMIGISKRYFHDLKSAIEFLKIFSREHSSHGI